MISLTNYLIEYLDYLGISHVFGMSGANIEVLYHSTQMLPKNISAVVAKHEYSAATMADGYSRLTNSLGVVVTTSGGGCFNIVPGLAESYSSSVPILAIIGQCPQDLEGKGGFQDSSGLAGTLDAHKIFSSVSKYCAKVSSVKNFQKTLYDAVIASLTKPKGPSVLLIPRNIQEQTLDEDNPYHFLLPQRHEKSLQINREQKKKLDRILSLFEISSDIVLILGSDVISTGSQKYIESLAFNIKAKVAVTPDAKSSFNNQSPSFLGIVGVMGSSLAHDFINNCDLCVILGTRLELMARFGIEKILKSPKVVYLGEENCYVDLENSRENCLKISLKKALRYLALSYLLKNSPSINSPSRKRKQTQNIEYQQQDFDTKGTYYREIVKSIEENLPDDANVFVDAGNTGAAVLHYLKSPLFGKIIVSLGTGGMGYSFGAGIGACFANRKRTYIIAGDGAFYMHGLEIHTAIEYELPITMIIFDNSAHGMCQVREKIYFSGVKQYNSFQDSYIANGLAAMFSSIQCFEVKDIKQLQEAMFMSSAASGIFVIVIRVDANKIPPFLPFTKNKAQISHKKYEISYNK